MELISIDKEIKKIEKLKAKIRKALKEQINALPGNSDIQVISDSPRIFTISSKHFTPVNWSPESYDYKTSHKMILKYLEAGNEENIISKLEGIIKAGKLPLQQGKLNPEVIKQLRSLL